MIKEKLLDLGIKLNRYYGNEKTTCPQCSHGRSNKHDLCLSVTIDSNGAVYNCHNCGFKGALTERTEIKRMTYKKPTYKQESIGEQGLQWLLKRGITPATIEKLQITTPTRYMPQSKAEKRVIAFPFIKDNKVVNVKYRSFDKEFTQEADCEKILYNLDSIQGAETVIWVEGEMDVLSLVEAGFDAVVSVPDGAPNQRVDRDSKKFEFIDNCADSIVPVQIHVLAFDNDKNGRILTEEIAQRVGKERCFLVDWEEFKDANEVLVAKGADYLKSRISCMTPYPLSGVEIISGNDLDSAFHYLDNCEEGIYSTGWTSLDKYFKVRKGELTVVTGIPNHGKSEFLDSLVMNLAKQHGHKFAVCSLENPAIEHKIKLCEKHQQIARWSYKKAAFRDNLKQSLEWVGSRFMLLHTDDESVTIDWIIARARELVVRYGIFGLVIDPHNQVEHKRPNNMTEHEYIGEVLRKLRSFAKSYGVHVFYVAHPRKIPNGEIPSLYDISGSANWANMADNGIVVHRETDDEGNKKSTTMIQIQKVRFQPIVGKVGYVILDYKPEQCSYTEDYVGS